MKILFLLKRNSWINYGVAKDAWDNFVPHDSYKAVQFTLLGALLRVYDDPIDRFDIIREIEEYLFKNYRHTGLISDWEKNAKWYQIYDLLTWLDI